MHLFSHYNLISTHTFLLNSISAFVLGVQVISSQKFSGLLFSPPSPLLSPKNLNSQHLNNSINTTLISLLAKNLPGHA